MTGQDEREAAQQVVDLFAAEALLALDKLQRLDARQAADRVVFLRDGQVVDQTAPAAGPESLLDAGPAR